MCGEWWLEVSIVRLTVSLLQFRMAGCGVRVTGLRPDPAVLIAVFLKLNSVVGDVVE
jgi:hypothetical protein